MEIARILGGLNSLLSFSGIYIVVASLIWQLSLFCTHMYMHNNNYKLMIITVEAGVNKVDAARMLIYTFSMYTD